MIEWEEIEGEFFLKAEGEYCGWIGCSQGRYWAHVGRSSVTLVGSFDSLDEAKWSVLIEAEAWFSRVLNALSCVVDEMGDL